MGARKLDYPREGNWKLPKGESSAAEQEGGTFLFFLHLE